MQVAEPTRNHQPALPTPEPAELASGVQFGQVPAEEAQTGALGSRKPAVSPVAIAAWCYGSLSLSAEVEWDLQPVAGARAHDRDVLSAGERVSRNAQA